jgi:prevent-host-death family protein
MVMAKKKRIPIVRETRAAFGSDSHATFSREVSAGEFKARCLALMDEVRDQAGEYIITKRGEPVAKLVPVRTLRPAFLGSMAGTVKVLGDIVSPLEEPWDALEGEDDER